MFIREREVKGRTDVNYYTARRLGDMAESLNQLAKAFDDGIETVSYTHLTLPTILLV